MKLKYIAVLVLMLGAFASCSKKETPSKKFYYGKVYVSLSDLPGTNSIDVYVADKFVGKIDRGDINFQMQAETPQQLRLYEAGTKNLLGDTTITIKLNETWRLMAFNSGDLQMKGWAKDFVIKKDTFSFQLFNNIASADFPDVMDLDIIAIDNQTLETVKEGPSVKKFTRYQMVPGVFYLPLVTNANGTCFWVAKMKKQGTEESIVDPESGYDLILLTYSDFGVGGYGIYSVGRGSSLLEANQIMLK